MLNPISPVLVALCSVLWVSAAPALAGSPLEDPVIASLRMLFSRAEAPTPEDLHEGETWECASYSAHRGFGTSPTVWAESFEFKRMGAVVVNEGKRKPDTFAYDRGSLIGSHIIGGGEWWPLHELAAIRRGRTDGELVVEWSEIWFDKKGVRRFADADASNYFPSVSDRARPAVRYSTCVLIGEPRPK